MEIKMEEIKKEIETIGWEQYLLKIAVNDISEVINKIKRLYEITIEFDTCFNIVSAVTDEIFDTVTDCLVEETNLNYDHAEDITILLIENLDTHNMIGVGAE